MSTITRTTRSFGDGFEFVLDQQTVTVEVRGVRRQAKIEKVVGSNREGVFSEWTGRQYWTISSDSTDQVVGKYPTGEKIFRMHMCEVQDTGNGFWLPTAGHRLSSRTRQLIPCFWYEPAKHDHLLAFKKR